MAGGSSKKLHFIDIDLIIYFPSTGNTNRPLKKYGVAFLDRMTKLDQNGKKINLEKVLRLDQIESNYPHNVGYYIYSKGKKETFTPDYIATKKVKDEDELFKWWRNLNL